jgi:hypothetical protein
MLRRWSRIGHMVAVWAFVALVTVQVFLAGLGMFAGAENFRTHVDFGYSAVWVVVLLIPVLAWLGRVPRRELWLSVLLLALYIPQCLLPPLARSGGPGFIAAFHPVNALLMFALGVRLGLHAWRERRVPLGSTATV